MSAEVATGTDSLDSSHMPSADKGANELPMLTLDPCQADRRKRLRDVLPALQ